VIPLRFCICGKGDRTSPSIFIKWITYIARISIIFLFLAQTLAKVRQSALKGGEDDGKHLNKQWPFLSNRKRNENVAKAFEAK
jgi:hypothetical protein